MNKFILIDKQQNQSSFDVIRELKKKFNHSDFGHTGTLDPLATGLLIIACGKETLKAIRFINNEDKEYIATLKLGIKTDTGDITGKILEENSITLVHNWNTILKSLIGKQMQIPPVYSAKKINGKKAYEFARAGQKIKLKPVEIEIKELEFLEANKNEVKFRTLVSKGTYIRTLCEEIAIKTNNIGTMKTLHRTKVGKFSVKFASTTNNIKDKSLLEILEVITLDKIPLNEIEYQKIKLGQRFNLKKEGIFALTFNNKLVSIVEFKNGLMKIIRNFNLIK